MTSKQIQSQEQHTIESDGTANKLSTPKNLPLSSKNNTNGTSHIQSGVIKENVNIQTKSLHIC